MTSKKVPFQNIKMYNHVTSFGAVFHDSETSKYLSNIYHMQYFKAMLKGFLIRLENLVSNYKIKKKSQSTNFTQYIQKPLGMPKIALKQFPTFLEFKTLHTQEITWEK